jgi:hypothetical protein
MTQKPANQVLLALHHDMDCNIIVSGSSLVVKERGQQLWSDDHLVRRIRENSNA